MAIQVAPFSLTYNAVNPKARWYLNKFIEEFCRYHVIKHIYIDTDHRSGNHMIKIILENTY